MAGYDTVTKKGVSQAPRSRTAYVSFDGGTRINALGRRPDRYKFWDDQAYAETYSISRGAGLSYVAASFGRSVVTTEHTRFNRILDFDAASQVIEVEAGVTLGQLYEFLTPRGYMIRVQPGHPRITVGGCIAADVHGKNQYRDGIFHSQVLSVRLFHASHGTIELSHSQNSELFTLTCGGYGLTGNILSAKLRVSVIPSGRIRLHLTRVDGIRVLPDLIQQVAQRSDLVYSWHDFMVPGDHFGIGWITDGSFIADSGGIEGRPLHSSASSLRADTRGRLMFPCFNSLSTKLFNTAYRRLIQWSTHGTLPLYDFLFPVHNKEMYFHLFGLRGFHEYQIILPHEVFGDFMMELRHHLQHHRIPITLASAKSFSGSSEFLRFSGSGTCFSLNFPRSPSSTKFAEFLDSMVQKYRARPNLIKDSRLSASVVSATYPEYESFREKLKTFDPKRLYRSELSERLLL